MGALMYALQVALASIPNIHVTAVLIIVTSCTFGWRAMYSVCIFVLLEGLTYGFGIWWVSYLYAWPLLAAVAVLMRKNDSALIWAVAAALHGLCFGALCALTYLVAVGWSYALSWWISGIPFDLAHCAGTFGMALVLFRPCRAGMRKALSL